MSTTTRGFQFFTGDVNWLDYGGVWARYVSGRRWHFIELINMDEACGRDNEGQPRYLITLSEVDLSEIPVMEIECALESCGLLLRDERTSECEVAGAALSYGLSSPLRSESTNNAHKGIARCRKKSYRLTNNAAAYEEAMERPVNRIGSTAREYGRGDLNSAVLRGLASGDKDAQIIAKMYVAADGQTLGGKIPESEPYRPYRNGPGK